jgi:hypothetical protein
MWTGSSAAALATIRVPITNANQAKPIGNGSRRAGSQ